MRNIPPCRKIIRLLSLGIFSDREISKYTGTSRNAIKKIRDKLNETKIELESDLTDWEIYKILFRPQLGPKEIEKPEKEFIQNGLSAGLSQKNLYEKYKDRCNALGNKSGSKSWFYQILKESNEKYCADKDLLYEPGEILIVQWLPVNAVIKGEKGV